MVEYCAIPQVVRQNQLYLNKTLKKVWTCRHPKEGIVDLELAASDLLTAADVFSKAQESLQPRELGLDRRKRGVPIDRI